MLFGNRRTRKSDARRRELGRHRWWGEELEDRTLLSIDLGVTTPPTNPTIANAPFGMDFAGSTQLPNNTTTISQGGAGWSVSDVGDVNGDQYDDFLIGGPTVSSASSLGSGAGSAVYLVFGSRSVGYSTITDWIGKTTSGSYQYTANNRVGDLGQLGLPASQQANPISGTTNPTFPFAGIAFTTTTSSQLGASVAGVKIGNTYGILMGAPNGDDNNNANPGTGRAYLITFASTTNFASLYGTTINLDSPPSISGVTIYTFESTSTGGNLGYSVAGGSNIFGDGQSDIILGAPNATFGTTGASGVVYAMSTALLSGTSGVINVNTLGQSGSQSAVFTGASSGSQAGWSVADGGDVNGATASGSNVDDLLIGAPSQNGSGAAYLIYGGSGLAGLAQSTTVNGATVRYINLANVGSTGTGAVPGATILGPGGSKTGWAVSSAGDFNADGFGDILIGSPQYSSSSTLTSQGLATILYGAASTSGSYLTGTITLGSTNTGISPLYMVGATAGALAGYAVSPVGVINSGQPTLVLVGSPGFNNNAGTAYLIPGRSGGLSGTQSLSSAESAPLSGVQFLLSTPSAPSTSTPFFGASVSSRIQTTTVTADGDSRQDFIIGAPGYDATQNSTRNLAGGAMIIQGGLITVPIPASTSITTQIGVGAPFAPFSINATTPANLQIYVFGTTTTNGTFEPVQDIDPTTVVVNGVAFPNATLLADPNKADWLNGIQDAIITITPRSSLGLTAGTRTITISGKTLSSSPLAGETWTGSATATVTGSSSGGSSTSLVAGAAGGPVLETTFNSTFGATQYVPTISQLSAYNYAPIPLSVAMQQYAPSAGFNERLYAYNHDGKHLKNYLTIRGQAATGIFMRKPRRIFVDNQILDRSRFSPGKSYTWTHKAPNIGSIYKGVVPVQLTTEHISDVAGVKAPGNRQIGHTPTSGSSFTSATRGHGE